MLQGTTVPLNWVGGGKAFYQPGVMWFPANLRYIDLTPQGFQDLLERKSIKIRWIDECIYVLLHF